MPMLTVGFSPPKGERTVWCVQKLVEIGIDQIVLIESERSIVRWAGRGVEDARARLERVAAEAASQSRRVWPADIRGPVSLGDFAGLAEGSIAMAHPWEENSGGDVGPRLECLGPWPDWIFPQSGPPVPGPEAPPASPPGPEMPAGELPSGAEIPARERQSAPERPGPEITGVVIGPEGGWSPEDIEVATSLGMPLVSLGSTVMRTETAALFAASLLVARRGGKERTIAAFRTQSGHLVRRTV